MGDIYARCEIGQHDQNLFEIVKRAAIHAFGPFADKNIHRRLTITFGDGHFICLSSNDDDLIEKYADVEAHSNHDYGFWTIIDVAKIVFEEEGEGMISYHRLTTGISVEACRANNDVDWVDRDSALRESFERCLRENIACSNEYCMA